MSVYVLGIFWTNRPRSHVVAPAAHAFARFETCRWRLRLAGYVTRAKNTQNQPALPARVLGGPAGQTARACRAMLPVRFAQWVAPGRKLGNTHNKMPLKTSSNLVRRISILDLLELPMHGRSILAAPPEWVTSYVNNKGEFKERWREVGVMMTMMMIACASIPAM